MKLTPETRAELEAKERRSGGRRVKKKPSTAALMKGINRAAVNRGTSVVGLHKLLYGKAPK
jgi:hypothetical protein